MNTRKFHVVLLLALAVVFVQCKDDADPKPDPTEDKYAAVVTADITPTEGPVSKITFPTNPTPTSSDIVVAYSNSVDGDIKEARVYFDVRETPKYVKDNKVKGEKEDSFTQTGVTIDMKDKDAVDAKGSSVVTGNTSKEGTTVTFYVRISTADNEYYYANDGKMYIDNVANNDDDSISDAFKDDPSLWANYKVQTAK